MNISGVNCSRVDNHVLIELQRIIGKKGIAAAYFITPFADGGYLAVPFEKGNYLIFFGSVRQPYSIIKIIDDLFSEDFSNHPL